MVNESEVEKVYTHITKGLLTKAHYPAETVINVFDNLQKDMIDKNQVCEDMIQIVNDEGTKDLIREYFGKLY